MCGRFTLTAAGEVVDRFFDLARPLPDGTDGVLSPRYNIAPTQPVLAVVWDRETRARIPRLFRWGLVPSWAKDASSGARMINARAETVAVKPAYRSAFKHRRCLIAADGFYEWQRRTANKARQPYYIRVDDGLPFALAGLWEHWEGPDGAALDSCTVITTQPNELIRALHDRMPVIIPPEDFGRWIDPGIQDVASLQRLLASYPADRMSAYPVSTYVNSPAHDTSKCIERIEG